MGLRRLIHGEQWVREQEAAAKKLDDEAAAEKMRAAAVLKEQEAAAAIQLAKKAERAEERRVLRDMKKEEAAAFKRAYGADSAYLGFGGPVEAFECAECGRWAPIGLAAAAARRLVMEELGLTDHEWHQVPGRARSGIRPAFFQRDLGRSYEEAVQILEAGKRVGLIEIRRDGRAAKAAQRCAECYERRASNDDPHTRESLREPIPSQMRFSVLQRDAFRCQYCGRSARDGATLHLDHVVPVAAGGPTTEDNLITACEQCNLGKSATRIEGI